MPGIVVGIDGSDHSRAALEWAVAEAGARHAALTVLAVHPVAADYFGKAITYPADRPGEEAIRNAAQELVDKVVSEASGKPASVTVRAVSGIPSETLINASRDADLLVVGRRGGGGFARQLVGSVSGQVVHHAECPTVVIPSGR